MANRLQKFIYTVSAESPILIFGGIVWLIKKSTWSNPIVISWKVPLVMLAIVGIIMVIFNISFNYGKKHLQTMRVTGTDISCGDGWIVAYIISYLLPFATFQFESYIKPVLGIIIVMLLVVLTFTDYVTPHPWLYLRRYHFYNLDVEGAASGYHLISRKKLRRPSDVNRVAQVFEFLLLREE
ncbi:hypothetical protein SAMN04487770_12262 [Butyrivibrio sp. ob235]|uniref:hypothetical protein n=1 Tax=Butyrivibrio sp. ob235 TaxID=1761780 RepID=UPI0008CFD0FA|nr:hypothetical protein [Butyrivibrio sp. ob235]SEL98337.1 hypothetical protein SAMN04487770_12262 [Butyrivibrio sp. ob235]